MFNHSFITFRFFALIWVLIAAGLLVACASSRTPANLAINTEQTSGTATHTTYPGQTALLTSRPILPAPTSTNPSLPRTSTPQPLPDSILLPTTFQVVNNTFTPTSTVNPGPQASLTSTPQPLLEAHTWEVEQVLVQVEQGGGDGCCYQVAPPSLVLYADGLLIKAFSTGNFHYEMHGRVLARQEVCALLNTFDQIGFLDYDHSIFQAPMDGAPSTSIIVNAWKSNYIGGQLLEMWVFIGGDWWKEQCPSDGCAPPPVILPALANTVKLLDNYDPRGLQRIRAESMILWALSEEETNVGEEIPKTWPIKEISLAEIAEAANSDNHYGVVITDRATVRALEAYVASGFYKEGDLRRQIFVRPLWPAETHFGISAPEIPTPGLIVAPGTSLSCGPEDGTVSILK